MTQRAIDRVSGSKYRSGLPPLPLAPCTMNPRPFVLSLIASLALSAVSAAQVQSISQQTIAAAGPLTAEQQAEIAKAMDGWAERVTGSDPDEVIEARGEIDKLATKNPSVTVAFRRELGLAFAKRFEDAVTADKAERSVSIFYIARSIGTVESIDFIVDHMDADSTESPAVRIAASAQLPKAVESVQLSAPQLDAIAKRLVTLAGKEREWVAATHAFEAMGAMIRRKGLSVAQADAIGSSMSATINDLTERVMDGSAPEMVNALQRALLVVRNQLSDVPAPARTKLLAAIAPSLKQLADSKDKTPPAIAQAGLGETFDAVARTAGLLQKVRSTTGT